MRVNINDILTPYTNKITILSLDCFDTLLWRKVASPNDVFYDLQAQPTYHSLGITAKQRVEAERIARKIIHVQQGNAEVTLEEIYRLGFPSLDNTQVQALMEDELAAEIATCYAFPPAIQLIRNAKMRNLKIIIVSSTYLQESQLRRLLSSAMPSDAYEAIDTIFCSCEFRLPKHAGLYEKILQQLSVPAQAILHIGDSEVADLLAPKRAGIESLRLIQHDNTITEFLRLQAIAATISEPLIRYQRSLPSPYRGVFAVSGIQQDKPEHYIGYASLGPVIYAMAKFVCDDVEAMRAAGKHPKVLFLMRDGFLFSLGCEAYSGNSIGKRADISRFSAVAASFRSKDDVTRYLAENFQFWRLSIHCNQFLLPPELSREIIKKAEAAKSIESAFIELILQEETLKLIFENSIAYADRLKRYLQNEMGVASGDSLVFVDIGYMGSAQRLLTPILLNEMGIKEVIGRYLVALDFPEWQFSRRGLIDPSWCDPRTIDMLLANFFLVEEMCCNSGNSVIDYNKEDGKPIYLKANPAADQVAKINLIQDEALRFIRDTKRFFNAAGISLSLQTLRDVALAELARSIYFSTSIEVEYLKTFQHEINKATNIKATIFGDQDQHLSWLRRRGIWFDQQRAHAIRTTADLEHVVMLMAQRRFSFDLITSDLSLRRDVIAVNIEQNGKTVSRSLSAIPTHGGYYSLTFYPIGKMKLQIEIMFGMNYQWIQFESAELIKAEAFGKGSEANNAIDVWKNFTFNRMKEYDDKLFRCESTESSMQAELSAKEDNIVLRIVFRPVLRLTSKTPL